MLSYSQLEKCLGALTFFSYQFLLPLVMLPPKIKHLVVQCSVSVVPSGSCFVLLKSAFPLHGLCEHCLVRH